MREPRSVVSKFMACRVLWRLGRLRSIRITPMPVSGCKLSLIFNT